MKKEAEAKAIILGSYMLFLTSLADKDFRKQKEVRKMIYLIKAKMKLSDRKYVEKLIHLSNEAWYVAVEKYKDKHYRIELGDAIEKLAFDNEKVLSGFYGKKILEHISNATIVLQADNPTKEIIAENREFIAELTKLLNKIIYDEFKGGKDE